MARQLWMARFARWHIWLGWLIGVPLVLWTVTGLVMVARPIDEVRGNHLRKDVAAEPLLTSNPAPIPFQLDGSQRYSEMRAIMQNGQPVWLLTREDGSIERRSAAVDGPALPPVDEAYVRALVAARIVGGDDPVSIRQFAADEAPFDFRRAVPSWQVALADGTNVYVHAETGEIAAVRTRFWRVFDFMWGLHIMDLQTREDTSHPILILFAALAAIGSVIGCILLFRRRRARKRA